MKKYKIVISCYSGEKDSGDEAMLHCVYQQLTKEIGNDFEFIAFCNNPLLSQNYMPETKFIYSGRHGLLDPSKKGIKRLAWIFEMIKTLAKCDILITGGGTLIYDESNKHFVSFWFIKIAIAQFFKKPTVFYGIGAGPADKPNTQKLMNKYGRKMNFISLRGPISKRCIENFNIESKRVFLTADPAITLNNATEKEIDACLNAEGVDINNGKKTVVIIAREWFLRPNRGLEHAQNGVAKIKSYENYIEQLGNFAMYLLNVKKRNIIFLPMGALPPCDDRIVINDILNYLITKKVDTHNVHLISDIMMPEVARGIISKAEAVITGRFHGLIYATSQYIPAIAMAYTWKYMDYYSYIGLDDYVIQMDELDTEILIEKYENIINNPSYWSNLLHQTIPEQEKLAQKNAYLVRLILEHKEDQMFSSSQ